jgi:hypothetical protein
MRRKCNFKYKIFTLATRLFNITDFKMNKIKLKHLLFIIKFYCPEQAMWVYHRILIILHYRTILLMKNILAKKNIIIFFLWFQQLIKLVVYMSKHLYQKPKYYVTNWNESPMRKYHYTIKMEYYPWHHTIFQIYLPNNTCSIFCN